MALGKRGTIALGALLLLAWLGTLDAAWLLYLDAGGASDLCSAAGCGAVLASRYAHPGGVPLALVGVLYYVLLGLGALAAASAPRKRWLATGTRALALGGVAASAFLTWAQIGELGALCPFCLASAGLSLGACAIALTGGWREASPRLAARTTFVVLELATASTGVALSRVAPPPAPPTASFDLAHALLAGNPKAPVRVVAFFDYECPKCREAWEPLSELIRASKGAVAVAIFALPQPGHEGARLASKAAELAAKRARFALVHDQLLHAKKLDVPAIVALGREAGLEEGALRRKLAEPGDGAWMTASLAEARRLGITAAPAVFADGKRIDGTPTLAALEAALAPVASGSAAIH